MLLKGLRAALRRKSPARPPPIVTKRALIYDMPTPCLQLNKRMTDLPLWKKVGIHKPTHTPQQPPSHPKVKYGKWRVALQLTDQSREYYTGTFKHFRKAKTARHENATADCSVDECNSRSAQITFQQESRKGVGSKANRSESPRFAERGDPSQDLALVWREEEEVKVQPTARKKYESDGRISSQTVINRLNSPLHQ